VHVMAALAFDKAELKRHLVAGKYLIRCGRQYFNARAFRRL
jgi:hypothetical protein